MKTMKLFSMAAVALLMAACSNSDDFDVQKPAETAGVYHFEATIAAPDADATMRTVYTEVTESTDPDYKKIKVAWKVGDKIALVHNGKKDVAEVKAVDASGKATIEATITGNPSDNTVVYLAYPADAVESAEPQLPLPFTPSTTTFNKVRSQDGTLEYIQNNLDFRMGSGKLAVSGSDVTLKESVSIPSLICIWKLTLQDNAATPSDLNATKLTFVNNNFIQARAARTGGKSEYYLCVVPSFIPYPSGTFSFVATVGSDTYIFSKTGLSLTAGKYYQSTVQMTKGAHLALLTANYEAKDGETLTGTLARNVKISIANNATVTLKDVTINGTDDHNDSYRWAGITCVGSATINLEGTNTVKGFDDEYPGISVPSGKTLTIQGTGSLDASSNGSGAGIGGGYDIACGNIAINGGTITATGGDYAAGIGGGCYDICGNIRIEGGTVEATGGTSAAGIGGGYNNYTCGTITITSGVTKVTATAGTGGPNSIGKGDSGQDITVTIDAGANVTQN